MTIFKGWLMGIILIGNFLTMAPAFAQQNTKEQPVLYVVRHAEKDTGNNPVLSIKGRERAGDLHRVLQNRPVDLILVSQYRRTGMTGDSVKLYRNIEMKAYKADATGDALFQLIASFKGQYKHILVIGHSNTVPVIVRRAGATDYKVPELPDSVYDHLFSIGPKEGKIEWSLEKFGVPSIQAPAETKMNISQ